MCRPIPALMPPVSCMPVVFLDEKEDYKVAKDDQRYQGEIKIGRD
jgi:hypothetical protein